MLALLVIGLGLVGCQTYSQKARDLFANGVLPRLLEMLANPPLDDATTAQILRRHEDDLQRGDTLRVAVIDNGVEYGHPALVRSISFDVEGGQIVGAGYDVMGDDRWAHPNVFNPSLFAFGARGLDRSFRIVDPPEDPIAVYDRMNTDFIRRLKEAIQSDPVLSESLFAKLNENSFTLSGAFFLLEIENGFDPDAYEKRKKEGKLIADLSAEEFEALDMDRKRVRRRILRQDWRMGTELGLPRFDRFERLARIYLYQMEHADRFFDLLEQTFQASDEAVGFREAFETLYRFRHAREPDPFSDRSELQRKYLQALHAAWHRSKFDFRDVDPLVEFVFQFREMLSMDQLAIIDGDASPSEKMSVALSAFKQWFDQLESVYRHLLENELLGRRALTQIQKTLEGYEDLRTRVIDYFKRRGFDVLVTGPDFDLREGGDAYRNYALNVANPFFDGSEGLGASKARTLKMISDLEQILADSVDSLERNVVQRELAALQRKLGKIESNMQQLGGMTRSDSVSHGTHVASTITAQDESGKLRIFPIRVLTASKYNSKNQDRNLKRRFLRGFENWTQLPLVQEAIYQTAKTVLLTEEDESLSEFQRREKVLRTIVAEIKDFVYSHIDRNRLDYEFFEEVVEAFKEVGRRKIKIANISLGANFSRVPVGADPNNLDAFFSNLGAFLHFEYFKYSLAEAALQHAPHTLFFVAAGNEGNWLDGETRSALPADLSSQWLAEWESDTLGRAPNNEMNNIVSVISLNPEGQLSAFTNLPIGQNAIVVATRGESVLAGIKTTDLQGAREDFLQKLPAPLTSLRISSDNPDHQKMLIELEFINPEEHPDARSLDRAAATAARDINNLMRGFLGGTHGILEFDFCIHSSRCDAHLSGTSMASPNMAGFAADLVRQRMLDAGLTDQEIYAHPDFSPTRIREELLGQLSTLGGRTSFRDTPRLLQPIPYQPMRKLPLSSPCPNAVGNLMVPRPAP
ncbi:MAG: hypothetical protein EA369_04275 [Bradymonadales bacterium]|nr:MAG: hypothetical protein EA369_04275 [Bradymonadales bacterium]